MNIEIFDVPQGTPEWHECRRGIPTASRFATVLAKGEGKTRRKYMLQLAGEILTGDPMDSFSNEHTERGHAMEGEARDLYCFLTDTEPQRVGFVRNGDKGCSPDSFIGEEGILEIKTKLPDLLIDAILKDEFPSEHKAQCQGALWVCEREWIDIAVYWPKIPLFRKRAYRDNGYIANLAGEINRFNDELAATVERIRRYGQPSTLMQDLKASAELLGAAG